MAIRTRLVEHFEASPDVAGDYGQAWLIEGLDFTVETQATGATVIASWEIACLDCVGDASISPAPSEATPTVLASGNSASPTWSHEATGPSAYCLRIRAWSGASQTGTLATEYREFHVGCTDLVDTEPCVLTTTAVRTAIEAQAAAGEGRHDNFFGANTRGWVGTAGRSGLSCLVSLIRGLVGDVTTLRASVSEAASAAAAAQADIDAVTIPETLAWSTTIECERNGLMEFPEGGTDESQVFTAGTPPYRPGAVVEVLIRAGRITGAHTVTVDSTIGQASELAAFDPAADYWLLFVADTAGSLLVSATSGTRPTVDVAAPLITSAVVSDATPDRVTVTTNEATTWTDATGFALTGYTLGAVTGSGTTHYIAISPSVAPGASLGSLTWDGTNTVVDGSLNALAAGSRSVTNNVAAPTIQSANIAGSALTLNMSEACACGGVTGLSLVGTAETISSLTSGSGTATLVFALSGQVSSGTLTLSASSGNLIEDLGGTALAAVSGVSVSLAAPPSVSAAAIDGATLVVTYDEAVTHSNTTNWSLDVGGTPATLTYASGSGTTALTYTSSVAATQGQVVTFSATAPTGHASAATGLALQAVTDAAVTNNTAASSALFRDDFDDISGWAHPLGTGTLTAVDGYGVEAGAEGNYNLYVHTAGGSLPADYEVEFSVPHADRDLGFYGLVLAYVPGTTVGIRVFRRGANNDWYVGNANSWNGGDVALEVTMPASWSTNRDHTVCVRRSGTTLTLYLDGELAATRTGIDVNTGVTGTSCGLCGDPYTGGGSRRRAYFEVREVPA